MPIEFNVLRLVLSLLVCFAVLAATLFFFKKKLGAFGSAKSSGALVIVDRHFVNPKLSLLLIEVDARRLLVGVGPNNLELVSEWSTKTLNTPDEIDSKERSLD